MDAKLVDVEKWYGGIHALRGVDLLVRGGEVHGLVGQNGAGKSTLIRILTGAVAPDGGQVLLDGRPVRFHSPADARAAGIGVVHQDSQVFPDLSVADNVMVAHAPARGLPPMRVRDRPQARRVARGLLHRLGVELDVLMPAGQAAPAERKFIEVARALAADARVLLLDEPTAALEPREVEGLFALLRRLAEQGVAILLVTHKLDEVLEVAHRVTALKDGRVSAHAEARDLTLERLVRMVAGATGPLAEEEARRPVGDPVLVARGVTSGTVGPVDLDARGGEVVSLTGLLGCGASRFARAVSGAAGRQAGEVWVRGVRLRGGDRGTAAARGVGFVPEDRTAEGIVPELSVEMNIALGNLRRVSRPWRLSRRRIRDQALRLMELLDIRPRIPTMPAGHLSGGNQQKVLLAKWLAGDSCVLVMEEPTHGIDVGAKAEIHRLIRRFAAEGGTVVLVSMEVAELLELSDRIGVFREGRLVDVLPRGATAHEVTARSVGLRVAL